MLTHVRVNTFEQFAKLINLFKIEVNKGLCLVLLGQRNDSLRKQSSLRRQIKDKGSSVKAGLYPFDEAFFN